MDISVQPSCLKRDRLNQVREDERRRWRRLLRKIRKAYPLQFLYVKLRGPLVPGAKYLLQIHSRNNLFHFSGFHAHNTIACVFFFVKNDYERQKLLFASFLTFGSNVFQNLHQICDILVCNMTRFWESQFSDFIDHHNKSALK